MTLASSEESSPAERNGKAVVADDDAPDRIGGADGGRNFEEEEEEGGHDRSSSDKLGMEGLCARDGAGLECSVAALGLAPAARRPGFRSLATVGGWSGTLAGSGTGASEGSASRMLSVAGGRGSGLRSGTAVWWDW